MTESNTDTGSQVTPEDQANAKEPSAPAPQENATNVETKPPATIAKEGEKAPTRGAGLHR